MKLKKHEKEEKLKIFVHKNKENIGRALTHNFAVQKYNYYYYIFSDLDTEFTSSFPKLCANNYLMMINAWHHLGESLLIHKKIMAKFYLNYFY